MNKHYIVPVLAVTLLSLSCGQNTNVDTQQESCWTDSILYNTGDYSSLRVISGTLDKDGSKVVSTITLVNSPETRQLRTDSVFSPNGNIESICSYSYTGPTKDQVVSLAGLSAIFKSPVNSDCWTQTENIVFKYNDQNQLTDRMCNDNGVLVPLSSYNYYPSGNLSETIDYIADSETEAAAVASKRICFYDSDKEERKRTEISASVLGVINPSYPYNNTRKDYSYDLSGRLENVDSYFCSSLSEDWSLEYTCQITYNDAGKVAEKTTVFGASDIMSQTFAYDKQGRVTKGTTINKRSSGSYGNEIIYSYDDKLGVVRKECYKVTDGIRHDEVYYVEVSKRN